MEEEKELAIAEPGTPEEQLAADAYALGKTVGELRELDITKSHVKVRYIGASLYVPSILRLIAA